MPFLLYLLVEEFSNSFTVTKHSVKYPGKSQTKNGPCKKCRENGLLLPLYFYRWPGQEVTGYPNKSYHP
jgi:hypothetical protein